MASGKSGKVLLVAVAVGAGVAAVVIRNRRNVAIETAHDIEAKLADLDPATRAGAVSQLAKDSIDVVRKPD